MSHSMIEPDLIIAYEETDYLISEPKIKVRIREHNLILKNVFKTYGVDSCAIISAANPYSLAVSDIDNAVRHNELKSQLKSSNFIIFEAEGRHPTGDWPAEPSFFILGISRDEANEIGKQFKQNAIVWCSTNFVPELVLLR